MTIVLGLIRFVVWGLDVYIVPGLTAGWFWEEQATLMFALLGGAFGFLWGAGAVYDFENAPPPSPSTGSFPVPLVNFSSLYIPSDDKAAELQSHPALVMAKGFFGAIPAIGYVVLVLLVCLAWLFIIIEFNHILVSLTVLGLIAVAYALRFLAGEKLTPPGPTGMVLIGLLLAYGLAADLGLLPNIFFGDTGTQTTNAAAERDEFSTANYNLLGLVELENASQSTLFIAFSLFVIFNIVGIAATLALILFGLNRLVVMANTEKNQPLSDDDFIFLKIGTFFTEWAIDVLNGVRDSVLGIVRR
jgi:hypothetical protein